jgi:error-prone DNA polymerase
MTGDFAHLHVASGFSMRYGASTPAALVERAAQHGQPVLALTDRDGLYGAVRFVQACTEAGIQPVLGVDLALDSSPPRSPSPPPLLADTRPAGWSAGVPAGPSAGRPETTEATQAIQGLWALGAPPAPARPSRRSPARGGAVKDPRLPRVTVLAKGAAAGIPHAAGWAALCRLVTATHLRGERGEPISSPAVLAEAAQPAAPDGGLAPPNPLVVLLGPGSDVGRALLHRRTERARTLLAAWQQLLPGSVAVEVVCHGGAPGTPGSRAHAGRLLGLADEAGVPAVLSAAVRHADRAGARTVDVLDAARRLVPLDTRHLDRVTDAGHLASTPDMHAVALTVTGDRARAEQLVQDTLALALACTQHPRRDLGIGAVHLPEPEALGIPRGVDPQSVLESRCREAVARRYPGASDRELLAIGLRLEEELKVVAELGYPTYFMTVAKVVDLIREHGVRVAARGSGAGSLINYLLGISGVDPIRYDLLMERFCSPLRAELPDIDIDVESARRTEIYEAILHRFSGARVTCVSMMDTYKVRHAIRDVGAALGLPPIEIDEIAKAFPHIRAKDARSAIAELPELRLRGLDAPRLQTMFDLVEQLDGLPRHIALHPCGVVLSNTGLLDRTPVEASWLGFPMSQFDKDDVEALGLLKLDVLGIRMQSAMAHAVQEVQRVDGTAIDLDDQQQVPLDDETTFRMIRTSHTLGCFQIESPGQRELIGKFGPERFEDLIIDISLFRPGPVKSDMITPFLERRHRWRQPEHLHPTLVPALAETEGVVVFHEQILTMVAVTTGVSLAQADEVRRAMGTPRGQDEIEAWWRPAAAARGYPPADLDRIWEVLKSFASFGFCKAHAAAFALPTYHSAWLKAHHPAAFLAGVLTHDPGMYPKRLILDDARSLGIAVLGLDVNTSDATYRVERVDRSSVSCASSVSSASSASLGRPLDPDLPDGSAYGIRLSLADVKGISEAEVSRIVAGQPYFSLADFWNRARVSRPVVERLVLAGGFDSLYGMGSTSGLGRRGRVTRRDLLLHVAELDHYTRAVASAGRRAVPSASAAARRLRAQSPPRGMPGEDPADRDEVRALAAAQSQAALPAVPAGGQPTQLALDLGDSPELTAGAGLPEMTGPERVRAELEVLGLDASGHVIEFYAPLLRALGVTRSKDLLSARSRSTVWACGVKVATQTPPIRSGRRVVFLTLDDSTGPVDATFFEDVQGPYAATVFHSWMLLVRGVVRRTGPRGISLRATGAWELSRLWEAWTLGGLEAVLQAIDEAEQRDQEEARAGEERAAQALAGGHRVLVHASGFKQSPYADTKPPGDSVRDGRALLRGDVLSGGGAVRERSPHRSAPDPLPGSGMPPRKLWHASPGSSGH